MFCNRRKCVLHLLLTSAPPLTVPPACRFIQQDSVSLNAETTPDFQAKKAMFYEEHMHEDAEVRLIVQGVGFFDVRNNSDDWVKDPPARIGSRSALCFLECSVKLKPLRISNSLAAFNHFNSPFRLLPRPLRSCSSQVRVCVETGDLLVLPAGIYHRFSIDEQVMQPRALLGFILVYLFVRLFPVFSSAQP